MFVLLQIFNRKYGQNEEEVPTEIAEVGATNFAAFDAKTIRQVIRHQYPKRLFMH